jgi:predicted metal-dependent peptidase
MTAAAAPESNKALSKAKIHLMSSPESTFFSVVCCNLLHVWEKSIPTAATDGLRIIYNEQFFMNCNAAERVGLILHEVLHVVFCHMLRVKARNHKKFNRAADYAINIIIDKAGFKLPAGALLDMQYDGMTAEQIYEMLDDEDDDDLPMDDLIVCKGDSQDIQNHIDNVVIQAAQASEAAGDSYGSIPAEVQRYIKELTHPRVPWNQILKSFFTKLAKVSYSYAKPNRRFFAQGILMPSMTGEKLCKGSVVIDVSCSVCIEQFNCFVAETAAILKDQNPDMIHFLQFDTSISRSDEIRTVQDLKKVEFKGGGGTDIEPVMEWARDENPEWMIIFTDGYYREPSFKPKCPIIWVIYGNPEYRGPFGKTIHYQFKDQGL